MCGKKEHIQVKSGAPESWQAVPRTYAEVRTRPMGLWRPCVALSAASDKKGNAFLGDVSTFSSFSSGALSDSCLLRVASFLLSYTEIHFLSLPTDQVHKY